MPPHSCFGIVEKQEIHHFLLIFAQNNTSMAKSTPLLELINSWNYALSHFLDKETNLWWCPCAPYYTCQERSHSTKRSYLSSKRGARDRLQLQKPTLRSSFTLKRSKSKGARTNPPFLVLKSRMPLLLQEKIDLLLEDGCSTRTGSSQRRRARGE